MTVDGSKRSKSSVKFWVITVSILSVPIVGILILRFSMLSEFEKRVAKLTEQGYPTSLAELDETYILPKGAKNAADIYIEAFNYYQSPTSYNEDLLPVSGNYQWPDNVPPFPDEVMDAMKQHLDDNKITLQLIDEAAKLEHCLWPRTQDDHYYITDNLREKKKTAQLLVERNLYIAQTGEVDKLFDSIQTSIKFSKTNSSQPFLIDHLVNIAIKAMVMDNTRTVLSMVDFSDDQLKTLQQQFAKMYDNDDLYKSSVIEQCGFIEFWRLPSDEQKRAMMTSSGAVMFLYSSSGLKRSDSLISLEIKEKQLKALKLPLHERADELERIEEEVELTFLMPLRLQLKQSLHYAKICKLDLRFNGGMKCAEVGIALERYRKANGELPDSLETLVPEFIAEVPLDPFDGEPLRYKKFEDGFTVYNVGDDRVDNNGLSRQQMKEKTGSQEPCDWPFTVRRKK